MLSHFSPKERVGYFAIGGMILFALAYVGAANMRPAPAVVFKPDKLAPEDPIPSGGEKPQAEAPATAEIVVHVAGNVKQPGLVRMKPGDRVDDAIRAAGGALPNSVLDDLNLAAKLIDGSQIFVKKQSQSVATKTPAKKIDPRERATRIKREITGHLPPLNVEVRPEYRGGNDAPSQYEARSLDVEPSAPSPEVQTKPKAPPEKKELGVGSISINRASAKELEELPGIGPATAKKIVEHRLTYGPFTSIDGLLDVKGIGSKKLEAIRRFVRL